MLAARADGDARQGVRRSAPRCRVFFERETAAILGLPEYYAAGPSRVTTEDGIHRCVHCETSGTEETYTYCPNCGAIACNSHTKTERLEGEPVCTGCAVTERFALKTKFFYDEQNLEAFREEYAAMLIHEKAMENKFLAGGGVVATLLTLIILLVIGGVI